VVQDVFLSLFEGKADPSENVARYLLVSVRRRALNALMRREARPDQASLDGWTHLARKGADGVPPDEVVHRQEEARVLAEALFELSPEQREVVLLRTFEGLPWKEVAALSGVGVPTASSRYRSALERLRQSCRSLSHA
jgi:RNA polymerase sigma-70 factor (ECF subfamily)